MLGSPGETVVAILSLTKFDGTPLPESLHDSEIASIIGQTPAYALAIMANLMVGSG